MRSTFLPVDLIVHHARIFDPITGFLPFTALAVGFHRFLALGSDQEILSLKNASTRVINARGHLMLPGFTDSHTHYWKYAQRQLEVNLEDCHTLSDTLQKIREKVRVSPEGSWITGGGWDYNLWSAGEYPHRSQLDEISTRHFIALDSKDWHTCWVNTPVLKMMGMSTDTPYPGAKQLAIHPVSGEFTGLLEEQARLAVYNFLSAWDYPRLRDIYPEVLRQFHRYGITSVHSVEAVNEFRISQEARLANQLGMRIFWYFPYQLLDQAKSLAIGQGTGDEYLQISGVKMFVDGAFGSQTAELSENYDGLNHAGTEVMTETELHEVVAAAVANRLSCAIHAIGDRAVQKTLSVLGKFSEKSQRLQLHHRIEHVQLVQPLDIPLFKKYNIFASVQPIHLTHDIPIIKKYLSTRAHLTYPFGQLHRQGARLLFGSDIPVEDFNPWLSIYTAMERKYLFREDEPAFFPEHKLDLLSCLQAYTVHPAEAVGMDAQLGRIEQGMLADFFLCNQDIFKVTPAQLKDTRSILTVVGGKIYYEDRGLSQQ